MTKAAAMSMSACYCIGPQNGDPVCPCQMRNVEVRDGRYVTVIDLGPVRSLRDFDLNAFRKAWTESEADETTVSQKQEKGDG